MNDIYTKMAKNFTPRQNVNTPAQESAQTPQSPLTAGDYEPEAIKRKITERLVEELHDRQVRGMPLYKLCAELLDRIEGKPIARTEASIDMRAVTLEVKAKAAIDEHIDRILKLSRGITP